MMHRTNWCEEYAKDSTKVHVSIVQLEKSLSISPLSILRSLNSRATTLVKPPLFTISLLEAHGAGV